MRPLRVEIVGLFPEFYRMCPTGCDWLGRAGVDAVGPQHAEYPEAARAAAERLAEVAARLLRDFGGRTVPVSVGYLSPRGLWLALRYRLRAGGLYAVVGGRCLDLQAADAYEALREAVAAALAGRSGPALRTGAAP